MKRKVCIVTGSRAEYGLLKPLIDEIAMDGDLTPCVMVTGSHLAPEFGMTYREIEEDGVPIAEKIAILLSSDTPVGIAKSMGLGLMGFAEAYARHNPAVVVGLGDRFELFSAVSAALVARLPVAHIHGGELTEGAIDDALRHAITKMSHLHFTATETYRRRVIQLGEPPDRVFAVGALGLDNILRLPLLSRRELERELDLPLDIPTLLVTFHPVTLEGRGQSVRQIEALFEVLDELPETKVIFTRANADTDGRALNELVDGYVARNPARTRAFASLGRLKYLSLLQYVVAVIGNSSSGIIEAPSFRVGTINIGDRQKGRIRAASVIDCAPTSEGIRAAFATLFSPRFRQGLESVVNPYGDGMAARRITETLKSFRLGNLVKKSFYDINFA